QQLVDELLVYTAPILLGGPHHAVTELGITTLTESQQFQFSSIHSLDTDIVSTLFKEHYCLPASSKVAVALPTSLKQLRLPWRSQSTPRRCSTTCAAAIRSPLTGSA